MCVCVSVWVSCACSVRVLVCARACACAYAFTVCLQCVYCLYAFGGLYQCVYDCACTGLRVYLRESVCVHETVCACMRVPACVGPFAMLQRQRNIITRIISLVNCVLAVSADRRFTLSWSSYDTRRVLFPVALSHCFYINVMQYCCSVVALESNTKTSHLSSSIHADSVTTIVCRNLVDVYLQ